jgi:hypothetical protein
LAACKRLNECPFFNNTLPGMPADADFYRDNYCSENYFICARMEVSDKLGPEKVPDDMIPNQLYRALRIVGKAP